MQDFMKKTTLYLIICCALLSCRKEEVVVINPPAANVQITIDQVVNDSTLLLKWTPFSGDQFHKYLLTRVSTYMKDGRFGTYTEPIDSSTDRNHLSFKEEAMPYASDVYYYLYVKDATGRVIKYMGAAFYRRPNTLVNGFVTDVIYNKQKQGVYITEQKKISVVDCNSGRMIISKLFPVNIGYCYLGEWNGSSELYVPTVDGWLQILDAVTLEYKDKIYVAGYAVTSVVAVKGKLFVGSSDMSVGYSNCIKAYDRATKALTGRTGFWNNTRLVHLEQSDFEFIDITLNLIPTSTGYYQFDESGKVVVAKEDSYHGDFSVNAGIVRSFPDGQKFITSSSGTVFTKSLVFDRYIKQYGNYIDFAFNNDGSLIYAASGAEKKVDVITYPATTNVKKYETSLYPYKIFREGDVLFNVGRPVAGAQMNYLLVEKITL